MEVLSTFQVLHLVLLLEQRYLLLLIDVFLDCVFNLGNQLDSLLVLLLEIVEFFFVLACYVFLVNLYLLKFTFAVGLERGQFSLIILIFLLFAVFYSKESVLKFFDFGFTDSCVFIFNFIDFIVVLLFVLLSSFSKETLILLAGLVPFHML